MILTGLEGFICLMSCSSFIFDSSSSFCCFSISSAVSYLSTFFACFAASSAFYLASRNISRSIFAFLCSSVSGGTLSPQFLSKSISPKQSRMPPRLSWWWGSRLRPACMSFPAISLISTQRLKEFSSYMSLKTLYTISALFTKSVLKVDLLSALLTKKLLIAFRIGSKSKWVGFFSSSF